MIIKTATKRQKVEDSARLIRRFMTLFRAGLGKFSSDGAIAEYAADIWNVQPCPVLEKAHRPPASAWRPAMASVSDLVLFSNAA